MFTTGTYRLSTEHADARERAARSFAPRPLPPGDCVGSAARQRVIGTRRSRLAVCWVDSAHDPVWQEDSADDAPLGRTRRLAAPTRGLDHLAVDVLLQVACV